MRSRGSVLKPRQWWLTGLAGALLGCAGETTAPTPSHAVATVVVTPSLDVINPGVSVQLVATLTDATGDTLRDRTITWTGRNHGVATVSPTGLVSGVAVGWDTITATSEGKSGSAVIAVARPRIDISGTWDFIDQWHTDGRTCNDTGTFVFVQDGITFTGTKDQVGLCSGLDQSYPTTLSYGVFFGDPILGDTAISFHVAPFDCVYVATLAGTPPDHLINGPVQCREGGTWAAARGGAVRSVAITPAAATVVAGGGVVRLRAVLRDSAGNRRVGPAVTWTSTAPDVATVASSYSVTADVTSSAPGTATIIATAEGLSGSASITVETIALASIEAGAYTTCGLTPGGAGYCWGDNTYAELGSGTWAQSAVPQAVAGGLTFAAITVGGVQTCGLTSNGTPHCWGDDVYGELGAGTSVPEVCGGQTDPCSPRPIAVAGGHAFSSISAGWGPTCALTAGGAAYCWGDNSYGQLGIGTGSGPENCRLGPCSRTPVAVQGGPPFVLVSAGAFHVCALTAAGAAYCWGDNIAGELGTGSATGLVTCAGNPCIPTPTPVAGGLTFTTLRVGFAHTCGRTTDGTWYCWGSNNYGQLGNGTTGPELCQGAYPCSTLPVAVAVGTDFSSVTPGYRHSCGITSGGAASCWGANSSGQLGDGTFASDSAAVTVAGGLSFASVSAYVEHTCGITTGGVAYCWGRNTWGELGDGQQGTDAVPQPIRVAGQTGAVATAALRAPNGAPAPGRAPPAPGRRPSRP